MLEPAPQSSTVMTDVLRYESSDKAALEPEEVLLWEGGGKKTGKPEFRITNRRAFYAGKLRKTVRLKPVRWPFRRQIVVQIKRSGATIQLGDELWITGVQDWPEAVAHLVRLNQRRLRKRRRRTSPRRKMETAMETAAQASEPQIDYSTDATDLGLIENEHVIWTGRPIVKWSFGWHEARKKLNVLGWLIIPSFLAWHAYEGYENDAMRYVFGIIAAVWFFLSLRAMLFTPVVDRWRLRRTHYTLTTRRAFTVLPQNGKRSVRFIFIDALPASFERQMQIDGSGDLLVGLGMTFRQIPDAMSVHQQLVNAVLTARRDLPDLGWEASPGNVAALKV